MQGRGALCGVGGRHCGLGGGEHRSGKKKTLTGKGGKGSHTREHCKKERDNSGEKAER